MKRLVLALAVLGTALAGGAAAPDDLAVRHFELRRSAPTADTVLSVAPTEVRLWFSQEPQEGSTSIRLVDAAGSAVHTGDVVQDPAEATAFSVALHGALAPGTYTVAWRALGQDGHVVRDDFAFTLAED